MARIVSMPCVMSKREIMTRNRVSQVSLHQFLCASEIQASCVPLRKLAMVKVAVATSSRRGANQMWLDVERK